jgi:hypothetical protein
MKLRKLNRILHRDLGYFFFGMTIIYSVSGVVLNHKTPSGDPSIVTSIREIIVPKATRDEADKVYIENVLDLAGERDSFKDYYFPSSKTVMIYLKKGHINVDLEQGTARVVKIRKRPVLVEFNFLHYNKPKNLWTWFSDFFAVSLGIIAITGLFILKGKHGITRRGAWLTAVGILIPTIFLFIYYWTV